MTTQWFLIRDNIQKTLDPGVFKVWIAPLEGTVEDGAIHLVAPNAFVAEWLKDRLMDNLCRAAAEVLACDPERVKIDITHGEAQKAAKAVGRGVNNEQNVMLEGKVSPEVSTLPAVGGTFVHKEIVEQDILKNKKPIQLSLPIKAHPNPRDNYFNSWRFSFDDFVVGPSNEMAFAAAKGLSDKKMSAETLFLSSGSGLGKTHLTHAIGRAIRDNLGPCQVLYLTAEEFYSRFVSARLTNNIETFKERLRNADVLLLEDVHLLRGKEKTQYEALAAIKSLQSRGSRVVLTSSFSPRELRGVDNQLVSHFCSGIIANIDRPNLDTRRGILLEKARLHQVILPDSVVDLLAKGINSDMRQLESCLNNLVFKAKHLNSRITLDMASDILGQFVRPGPQLDMEKIVKLVCGSFSLNQQQLCSKSRRQECVMARNTIYYLARKHTGMSLQEIGEQFNRRHTTVIKGISSIERELRENSRMGRQVANTLELIERNASIM